MGGCVPLVVMTLTKTTTAPKTMPLDPISAGDSRALRGRMPNNTLIRERSVNTLHINVEEACPGSRLGLKSGESGSRLGNESD